MEFMHLYDLANFVYTNANDWSLGEHFKFLYISNTASMQERAPDVTQVVLSKSKLLDTIVLWLIHKNFFNIRGYEQVKEQLFLLWHSLHDLEFRYRYLLYWITANKWTLFDEL